MDKGHLIAKNPLLPNLNISDLYNPQIDTLTKKISKYFLLHDTIFPVFHLKKVAFLCLAPQILNIDGKLKPCSRQALTFDKHPLKMTLNNTIISLVTIWQNRLKTRICSEQFVLPKYFQPACFWQNYEIFSINRTHRTRVFIIYYNFNYYNSDYNGPLSIILLSSQNFKDHLLLFKQDELRSEDDWGSNLYTQRTP